MSLCAYLRPETGRPCPFEAGTPSRYCCECARLVMQERSAFEGWMQRVVQAMEADYGLHPDDLPDCAYADWHAAGLNPEDAARDAIALCMGEE